MSFHVSLTSFKALKEILKPCSNLTPTPSPSPSSSLIQSSFSQEPEPALTISRKPPKSSLSKQLQRLGEPFLPSSQQNESLNAGTRQPQNSQGHRNEAQVVKFEEGREKEEKEREFEDFGRTKLGQFDHTGPFEPLVLSLLGEVPVIRVPASINCRLLEHQREGVRFLYKLYRDSHGGVLGDDMGLGKTIQAIAFLAAVFEKDEESVESTTLKGNHVGKKGPVLIICPTSVIHNWEIEFSRWASFSVSLYHGTNRDLILEKLKAGGVEILITSFDTYRIHGSILSEVDWEGTVMQNKIMELFNLLDWVAPGSLGSREHFREFYDEPLKHGQRSTAPESFVRKADKRKEHLVAVLRKYMLRRTKEETIGHLMMGKEDNVVFCSMSELQKRVYRSMLQLPDIQCLVNKDLPCSCGSPLKQVACCKRIVPDGIIWPYLHRDNPEGCDSCPYCLVLPCLVKLQQISNHLELIKPNPRDELDKQKKDAEFASAVFGPDVDLVGGNAQSENFMGLSDVKHCGKMQALEKLMFSWASRGDKILLFSYSVRMLDILEKFLIRKGYSFSRLDGSTPSNLRQSLVDDFNSSPSKQVFLISTRAGGLGLNLVSANRVVIFDPNWNPAQDLQAQDRSFRYGQKRHVVVFRLLAAGSFEELVYSRQVYKQQLSNIAVSGKIENRYFEGVQVPFLPWKGWIAKTFRVSFLVSAICSVTYLMSFLPVKSLNYMRNRERVTDNALLQSRNYLNLGLVFLHPDQATSTTSSACETSDNGDPERVTKRKPVLEELGILYTHRNEDIVNNGPGIRKNTEESIPGKDSVNDRPVKRRRKPDDAGGKRNDLSSKDWKKIQYSLLAQFMGMGELEFSNWVLSATPSERENVLRDYKKRKEKMPA
ncbi:hypothetical protein OIU84_027888 [Salix udensis]|uniref:Helicase C-terminal domain-containing protein n=1 Tax=Salix udensis TaxID=889485 RepID=A0AAD6KBD8_9ROSI|nr:hypothetical protein OIU84_027888 [Salix udensis]